MRIAPALVPVFSLLLAPTLGHAQNSTAAGIEALWHDDPASAARILNSAASSNPVARFFRAALDETGFGSGDDPFLACRLLLFAAGSQTPLSAPARTHLEWILRESPDLAGRCDGADERGSASEPEQAPASSGVDTRGTWAGVAAFVAGDYQTAAGILRPIAERNRRLGVDAVAAFFTAAMYQSGIGLPRDSVRACALYMRAGPIYSDAVTWFERLNLTLARDMYNEVPEEQRGLCGLLGMIGFDHRFEPATFSLEPGRSVAFTLRDGVEAAVTYQGREVRQSVVANTSDGLRFLPLRFTELPARPPALGRRHFVEIAMWVPASDTSWQLDWTLVEIVGDAAEIVAREILIDSAAQDAPGAPLDLRTVVVVRNDDAGRAEWALLTGPEARSEFIPTRTELGEIRAENEARDKRKTVARPREPLPFPRPPAFRYVDADGCADLFAFAWSADGAEVLTVRADRDALQLSTAAPRTFDLSAAGPDLEIEARVANRARHDWGLCTDVRSHGPGDEDEPWRAVSGLLTIQIAPAGIRVSAPWRYRASIVLTGAEFVGPTGARVRLPEPITMTAWVGSIGGPPR